MFYGPAQAAIHHKDFGDLAEHAADALLALLAERGLTSGLVVDLGCGSGVLADIVHRAGFEVIGVDISPDMVELARLHAPHCTFQVGSLLDVELPPAVAVTAVGEALNYAADPRAGIEQLESLAAAVRAALDPRGVFLFDVATREREARTVVHDRPEWTLCMRAEHAENSARLDRFITIFHRDEGNHYLRVDEHHVLRLYDPDAVTDLLVESGFRVSRRTSYGEQGSPSTPPLGWCVLVAWPV